MYQKFLNLRARASHNCPVEADTISKNGRNPKSQMSRESLQIITVFFAVLALMVNVFMVTSCKKKDENQKVPAPTGVTASQSGSTVAIYWNNVSVATEYVVFRSNNSDGTYSQIGNATNNTQFVDNKPLNGDNYYKVKSVNSAGESDYSDYAYCNYSEGGETNFWTQKADFAGGDRCWAVGFSIGNKGYIGTGRDVVNYKQDFWEYDPSSNVWTQKADFPGAGREKAVGFSIGNKGYIGIGEDGDDNIYQDFWEYDPSSNIWTKKADFPGGKRMDAVGFSIGNKGYIGTGYGNYYNSCQDFWEYDPASNKWTQKADFAGGSNVNAVGFSIGNKGYIGTGNSVGDYQDFWEYDPASNSWTQKADFAGGNRGGAVGFSIGNKGYIGTGCSMGCNKDLWEYDPSSNSWTRKADLPIIFGRNAAVAFSIGNKGYFGTGCGNWYYDFWEYTP